MLAGLQTVVSKQPVMSRVLMAAVAAPKKIVRIAKQAGKWLMRTAVKVFVETKLVVELNLVTKYMKKVMFPTSWLVFNLLFDPLVIS